MVPIHKHSPFYVHVTIFYVDSAYKRKHAVDALLWLILLDAIFSSSSTFLQRIWFHFSLWLNNILWYVYTHVHTHTTPYFLYSFISCWAPWLFPQFACCEESCTKHRYAGISLGYWFTFLCMYAQEWYDRVKDKSIFIFEEPLYWFHSGCTSLYSTNTIFPHNPCQYFWLVVFWIIVSLTGARWNLGVVLICIFFMAKNAAYLSCVF
jgi:hypothetical protein